MLVEDREIDTRPAAFGAVILAAGYSSRMGAFKPLLEVGETTAVTRIIKNLQDAGVHDIVVVTGHNRDLLEAAIKAFDVKAAYNARFDEGMFTSVLAGIEAFSNQFGATAEVQKANGIFLVPVDCPAIDCEVLLRLKAQIEHNIETGRTDLFVVPCYEGKKGHPLFIPSNYFKEILEHDGTYGLKGITDKYEDKLLRLETGDEGVVLDMDTQQGYEALLAYIKQKETGVSEDANLAFQGRLFLVRHGEIEQHVDKILLGQTDVPLNDKGRHQALNAGLELAGYNLKCSQIYASDLSRAFETAEIIRTAVNIGADGKLLTIEKEKDFREMHLGDWDGCLIHEIKHEFPEEYEKRGQNLLKYKTGHDGENFYDLQYRVMKALKKILMIHSGEASTTHRQTNTAQRQADTAQRQTNTDDIIIVTHSGVIKVILCNLLGYDLEEIKSLNIPKGSVTVVDFNKGNVSLEAT